jgi:nitroreductase
MSTAASMSAPSPSASTDLFSVLHTRRSIREYQKDKPVDDALLDEIFSAAIHASSSGNMQTYSIIVTTDPELRRQLYKPHMEQSMVLDAQVLVTFCADFRRMRKWLTLSNALPNFDNFMSFMIATIDATLVSQNVALAAEAKGLGLCYMGSTLANCDQIGEILKCPPGVVPVVGFSLGWPAESPKPRDRLPLKGLIHRETYHDHASEEIQQIYEQREKAGWTRYNNVPELRAMIEASGVENLAQVYTTLKYTKESHLEYSQTVLKYLETQEFMRNAAEIVSPGTEADPSSPAAAPPKSAAPIPLPRTSKVPSVSVSTSANPTTVTTNTEEGEGEEEEVGHSAPTTAQHEDAGLSSDEETK